MAPAKPTSPLNGATWKWVVGILLTVVLSLLGVVYAGLNYQVRENSSCLKDHGERIKANETSFGYIREQLKEIKTLVRSKP